MKMLMMYWLAAMKYGCLLRRFMLFTCIFNFNKHLDCWPEGGQRLILSSRHHQSYTNILICW
jgi:hypothetical protein